MNIRSRLLGLLLLFFTAIPLRSESAQTISIDTPDTTAGELARAVGDMFTLNIVMPDALAEQKVGLKLRDVSWRTVFKIAYEPLGYTFYEEDNVVYFTNDREFMAQRANSELLKLRKENQELKAKIQTMEDRLKTTPPHDQSAPPVSARQVECTIPVLPVADLARGIAFYTETLGFRLDWGGAEGDMVCSVSRDKRSIMLMQTTKPTEPVWVWMGVDVALFETYRAKVVKVVQEPRNHTWAYEMKFADPDGNILWLGSDPRKDLPFEDDKK